MEYKAYQNKLSRISARFNLMVFLVFCLGLSNILLAGLSWYTSLHQKIEITPFSGSNSYIKSESEVDAHYLSLMSENFIYSRLNVTPESVDANHKRLMPYIDASNYNLLLSSLKKEADVIKAKKISGVFLIKSIQINPKKLTANVSGVLTRRVGLRNLQDEKITYKLSYRYRLGRLTIAGFTHYKEKGNEKA